MKKIYLTLFIMLCISGCRSTNSSEETDNYPERSFQITFQNSDKLILDDSHLDYYEVAGDAHILHLNASGYEKIKSFMLWDTKWDPPTINPENLFMKIFSVKLNGKELYSGKFFSLISSQTYDGIIIMDVYTVLKSGTLTISCGYPATSFFKGVDLRNNEDLFKYLAAIGKLRK